ncbi:MAG: hypothetical protein HRT58_19910 [Crocinitomicaceae bacterium]|nr:hypothetical protein [Flavobacteriales bacterium]NQZ37937.1 hypothetical protein [Crocinitomicaceae bacterium]
MQRKTLSLVSMIALCLILIGCNRGCTTSRTIASESKTIATSGGDVEIIGRVIDYRHSKRRGQDIFDRKVSHTFGLSFDVKYGTFEQKEFYHEGVKDPDLVKLPKELNRVKVAISNDRNHIGLGVDGKVVDLIHLYKSNRIQTMQSSLKADGTMDWSKLDINSYPTPSEILTESLKNSCEIMTFEKDAMFAFCDSKKPSDKIHQVMLNKWPRCSLAKSYLSEKKIKELSKDKTWKRRAIKRGTYVIKNKGSFGFDFDNVTDFASALNSPELNVLVDSLLLEEWGRNNGNDYTKALTDRIGRRKNALNKSNRMVVYIEAKREFSKFLKTGESNYQRESSKCLQVLKALGDTMSAFNFVQEALVGNGNIGHFNSMDFIETAYDDMDVFTDYQQRIIILKSEDVFDYCKDYSRSILYSAIEDLVDCSMLKRLKKKYPKDLKYSRIPSRCGP